MPPSTASNPGYSGTPLAKKLGIKPGNTLLLVDASPDWELPEPPEDVKVRRKSITARAEIAKADVVIAFFSTPERLLDAGPQVAEYLGKQSSIWVAWPRRAGGHNSGITDQLVRDALLPVGIVDVKLAALDNDWSGLKFVWRVENRN